MVGSRAELVIAMEKVAEQRKRLDKVLNPEESPDKAELFDEMVAIIKSVGDELGQIIKSVGIGEA